MSERLTLYSPIQPVEIGMVEETGDPLVDSFTRFYARLQLPLSRYAARRTGDVFAAEDLVQMALLKDWRSWPDFQHKGDSLHEKRWGYAIIRNLTIDYHNSSSRQVVPLKDIDQSAVVQKPGVEFEEAETGLGLKQGQTGIELEVALLNLAPLNNQQRDVLVDHYILGKPYDQIAKERGNSVEGLKKLAQRGKNNLRKFTSADD